MDGILEASVRLREERFLTGSSGENPEIAIGGDGGSWRPMELLLLSLASCSSMTILAFLKKFGKDIADMKTSASGQKHEQHPKSFEKIRLRFTIWSEDAQEQDIRTAIMLSEKKYCPVWAMLKNSTQVETEFQILRP